MKTILLVLTLALTITLTSNAATKHPVAKSQTENAVKAQKKSGNASNAKKAKAKKHSTKKHAATSGTKKPNNSRHE